MKKELVDAKVEGSHLFNAVDYHETLVDNPIEVDMKLCNKIEHEFHEQNDWVMQESNLTQTKHDMVRVDE